MELADLNIGLSHLSDAKHALKFNKMEQFKYFINQSYLKGREALYKVDNIIYKIYVYSLIIFNGFLIFSEYGKDFISGMSQIKKILHEMNMDKRLNRKLKNALNKSFYWKQKQKLLISHCILFSTKISLLIRSVNARITQNNLQRYHDPEQVYSI